MVQERAGSGFAGNEMIQLATIGAVRTVATAFNQSGPQKGGSKVP